MPYADAGQSRAEYTVLLDSMKLILPTKNLNPTGSLHIPIGIPNTLDALKTFVEAEGGFSPGFGTYGIYVWLFDKTLERLFAPTMPDVSHTHGLSEGGYLIPYSNWVANEINMKTQIYQVLRNSSAGDVQIVGLRTKLTNTGQKPKQVALYLALRPLGPAGFDVHTLTVSERGDALLVDNHPVMVVEQSPTAAGVLGEDEIGYFALRGKIPEIQSAKSEKGNCSGALRFDLTLKPGESKVVASIYPVLAGRNAVRHQWDGVSAWAQFDLAKPNSDANGIMQLDPGLNYYRQLKTDQLFDEANRYWQKLFGRAIVQMPDSRWQEAFTAIIGHAAMSMNEGAPDVAVVNYNVFNRDGVYVVNMLQKTGRLDLAQAGIDYFLNYPFNGRSYPEADNPGQILWIMGEHWRFTHDTDWLKRVYPSAKKISEMIEYFRTTEGPHWVQMEGILFGEKVPKDKRGKLEPGKCDGYHPEYTEAFDLAGIRAMAVLAEAAGEKEDSEKYQKFAEILFKEYHQCFGDNLPKGYGSYSVLWPCRLYPLEQGAAYDQFKDIKVQQPRSWRYFPLATAHQGLLTGSREAAYKTLAIHFEHPQMKGWYAFDEGGASGSGGWGHVRTTWHGNVAMPHGWAIAEFWLLMRDCLLYEAGKRLVLLSGVHPEWFKHPKGMKVKNLTTYFGNCSFEYIPQKNGAVLKLDGKAQPPEGFVLRLPTGLNAQVMFKQESIPCLKNGDFILPKAAREIQIYFKS